MIKCCDHQRDFTLYFEEAGKCARDGLSSCVNSLVRGAASASLWGLRVYGTRESEGL